MATDPLFNWGLAVSSVVCSSQNPLQTPLPTHACKHGQAHTPLLRTGKAFVVSSQDYRHWSHLQVIWLSSDVIFEPRDTSQFKEVLTDSLLWYCWASIAFQSMHILFFIIWRSFSFMIDFYWWLSSSIISLGQHSAIFPQKWNLPLSSYSESNLKNRSPSQSCTDCALAAFIPLTRVSTTSQLLESSPQSLATIEHIIGQECVTFFMCYVF